MMHRTLLILGLSGLFVFASPLSSQTRDVIGYYPSWKWRYRDSLVAPARIAFDKVTIINYAFFYPLPDGTIAGKDPAGDSLLLNGTPGTALIALAHRHGVRVLLSFGGWEDSGGFPAVAGSAVTRARFAHSCIEAMRRFGFDGIDIDWESPGLAEHNGTPADKENCTVLLRVLRDSINAYGTSTGKRCLLTAALPSTLPTPPNFEVGKIAELLDYLNIMSYDYHGPWSPKSGHNAPLAPEPGNDSALCLEGAYRLYHETYGVPASKINLGVAFYGQTFTACTTLNAPHAGSDTVHFSPRGAFYYDIVRLHDGFERHWDDKAGVPYLVSLQWHLLLSYDDPASIALKARYVVENGIHGLVIWELTGDMLDDGSTPLLDAIDGVVRGGKSRMDH